MAITATGGTNQGSETLGDPEIRSLHHVSLRCFDPEATRHFYEDLLGLEFSAAIPSDVDENDRPVESLQLLFRMVNGDFITFYHVPGDPRPELYRPLGGQELHLGMKVPSEEDWVRGQERLKEAGVEFMGPLDHDFVQSIYFPDPNGIMLEFTYEVDRHEEIMADEEAKAREALSVWTERTAPKKVRP